MKQGTLFSFFKKPPAAPAKANKQAPAAAPAATTKRPSAPLENPLLAEVKLGSRIEVYWKDDDAYYAAIVSKQRESSYFLEYDDGQQEWLDLGTETFRLASPPSPPRPTKRRRIQDDDEEEAEFDGSLESDDGSVYEQNENAAMEDDNDENSWIVSDGEDEEEVRPRKKRIKVTQHKTSSPTTSTPSTKKTSLHHFGHTPRNVTPASSARCATPSPSSKSSPVRSPPTRLATPAPSTTDKAPPFEEKVVNPAGSHVHNHLPFLRNPCDIQGRSRDDPNYDPRTLKIVPYEWKKVTGKEMTNAVKQWWDLKSQYFDTVLLFKTGKFYEMFHTDADVGVQVLGLTYMKGIDAHAGFPEISYGTMADKLVRAGYKVARVEQTETQDQFKQRKSKHKRSNGPAPKVVNREVCSVMTLGTRTFCFLDGGKDVLEEGGSVGPLLVIREIVMPRDVNEAAEREQPVCEYGITLVDAVRGVVTLGQFADDALRSRMDTLLATFTPSEVLLQGGEGGASDILKSLIKTHQAASPHPFRVETIGSTESFPKSTALDPVVRRAMDRGTGRYVGTVHPWEVEETIDELHRRQYYPRGSKKSSHQKSISRWPQVLRAAIEGNAELAISSLGAALFYLQRSMIDGEILSMGNVKAYVPPTSTNTTNSAGAMDEIAIAEVRENLDGVQTTGAEGASTAPLPASFNQQSMSLEASIDHMQLDGTTLHNLEVLTNSVDYKVAGSLWSKINCTKTPHGARLLRAWLLRPLFRKADIERRGDAVQELVSGAAAVAFSEAAHVLAQCGDIERLLSRIHSMSGTFGTGDEGEGVHPNTRAVLYEMSTYTKRKVGDFSKALAGLRKATQIPEIFQGVEIQSGLLKKLVRTCDQGGCFPNIVEEVDWFYRNFDCDRAAQGLFEPTSGVDAAYDEACEAVEQIQNDLKNYKQQMCQELSPISLATSSWKYANTKPESKDKYLIELPASVSVPDDFIMKGKRGSGAKQVNKYRTAVVQKLVDELEYAIEVKQDRKAKGMQLIFAKFDESRNLWAAAAQATALLDAIGSLAQVASRAGYSRPIIVDCPPDSSPTIKITQGRHPGIENSSSSGFVPNDLALGSQQGEASEPRILLLSGPNMGGKSTLLRQTCLITILAQIGCFVPAERCEMTPVDRIFTRLGATDRLLMGQSTFFVELAETAAALRGATRRSLVIMDELGRGTSTFDGTAIASSTVKHLVERNGCLSLFATHYHSLLDEWKGNPSVKLGHMECVVGDGTQDEASGADADKHITFLYTLGEGVCPRSFGINVARLAGLPDQVLTNAARISNEFENSLASDKTNTEMYDQIMSAYDRNDWTTLSRLWQQMNS